MANRHFRLDPISPDRPITRANAGDVKNAMRDFAADLVRRMGNYPPPSSSYVRTGDLGRFWTMDGPRVSGNDLVVQVGNAVRDKRRGRAYASFVQGLRSQDPRQTRVMAGKGWESVEDAAKEEWNTHRPRIEKAIQG